MKTIPYSRQSINDDDIEAVCEVLRSDWLTQGPKVKEFEQVLAWQCGAKHGIVTANGTMALHMACLALEIGPGDAGLTSPISFLASANCVAYGGGTPDFIDISPETLCLSPEKLEAYCKETGIPKVVIPVDFAGVPAELPRVKSLADQYGFKVIEDAAHAVGSTYSFEGKAYACGSCAHTDMAVFSFHPVKTVTTGEGGAVLTNDDGLAEKLRYLVNHGVERDPSKFRSAKSVFRNPKSIPPWYYEMHTLGYNGRITDIQCALGLSQLRRIDRFKEMKQEIFRNYNKALQESSEEGVVVLPPWPDGTDPCFHLYPLRLGPECKIHRDELFFRLREKGIYCQIHYIPIYRQPFFENHHGYEPERFPETEKYFSSCLSLPLFPDLSDGDFHYVTDTLLSLMT